MVFFCRAIHTRHDIVILNFWIEVIILFNYSKSFNFNFFYFIEFICLLISSLLQVQYDISNSISSYLIMTKNNVSFITFRNTQIVQIVQLSFCCLRSHFRYFFHFGMSYSVFPRHLWAWRKLFVIRDLGFWGFIEKTPY